MAAMAVAPGGGGGGSSNPVDLFVEAASKGEEKTVFDMLAKNAVAIDAEDTHGDTALVAASIVGNLVCSLSACPFFPFGRFFKCIVGGAGFRLQRSSWLWRQQQLAACLIGIVVAAGGLRATRRNKACIARETVDTRRLAALPTCERSLVANHAHIPKGNTHLRTQHTIHALLISQNIVKALCEKGADIHHQNKYKLSALLWACERGHAAVVAYLLAQGARMEDAEMDDYTPLLLACKNGHKDVVALLLAKGIY